MYVLCQAVCRTCIHLYTYMFFSVTCKYAFVSIAVLCWKNQTITKMQYAKTNVATI